MFGLINRSSSDESRITWLGVWFRHLRVLPGYVPNKIVIFPPLVVSPTIGPFGARLPARGNGTRAQCTIARYCWNGKRRGSIG